MKKKLVNFAAFLMCLAFCLFLITACAPPTTSNSGGGENDSSGGNSGSGNITQGIMWGSATLLANGRMLLAGKIYWSNPDNATILPSCEIYNPTTDSWTVTGNLNQARFNYTSTLLNDGRVLVAGGEFWSSMSSTIINLSSCEIYNPATGVWSVTDSLNQPRSYHKAVLLNDGRVLVVGGEFNSGTPNDYTPIPLSSCEIYNPNNGTWDAAADLSPGREYSYTVTLLANGYVLIAGGYPTTSSCEIYDPSTNVWITTGNLNQARKSHSAVLLNDGRVLVVGGEYYNGSSWVHLYSSEIYDPNSGYWSITGNLNQSRRHSTAVLLSNGRALVMGGFYSSVDQLSNCEIYNPATGVWSVTGSLNQAMASPPGILLSDSRVLILRGFYYEGSFITSMCEYYDPATGIWTTINSFNLP